MAGYYIVDGEVGRDVCYAFNLLILHFCSLMSHLDGHTRHQLVSHKDHNMHLQKRKSLEMT
jgi:hypothetical protein